MTGFSRRIMMAGTVAALPFGAARAQQPPADEAGFAEFVQTLRAHALAQGLKPATLDAAFSGVRFNARVIALDNHQPEFTTPIQDYIAQRTSADTLRRGREHLARHAEVLGEIARQYGVQGAYIVAIWRLESGYGQDFGNFKVVEVLATLAFRGRRPDFWRGELIEALRLIESGEVPAERLIGSWAGAMGHTQFMPSAYRKHAVDFDKDGKRDLWRSLPDVFASTANYLKGAAWRAGEPFGAEVKLPKDFAHELADTAWQPREAWLALGVAAAGTDPLPGGDCTVLLPAGHRGPALMVGANYKAILDYNNAMSYALAVGLLAERLTGRGRIEAAWPAEPPLGRADKEEMQRLLAALGHDPGKIDGQIGPMSRGAIRAFQKKTGLPADGHANADLLARLRAAKP